MKNQPTTELNQQSQTTLCAKVSAYKYPIHNFKFEPKF